jgi:integrase
VGLGGIVTGRFDLSPGLSRLPLPKFAVDVLIKRRSRPLGGGQKLIFPPAAGTWRDPENFRARWRKERADVGVPDVTSHSFRKSLATLIDDEGLSARIGADHLGHDQVSETQDTYMARAGYIAGLRTCWTAV